MATCSDAYSLSSKFAYLRRLGVRGSSVSIAGEVTEPAARAAVEDIRFDGMHWTALVKHEDQQLRFVLDHESQVQTGGLVALSFTDADAILYS